MAAFNTGSSMFRMVWCGYEYGCSQHPVFVFKSPDPPQPQTPVQSFSLENDRQRWEMKLATRREKFRFSCSTLSFLFSYTDSKTFFLPLLLDIRICIVCLFLSTPVHQLSFLLLPLDWTNNSHSEQFRAIKNNNNSDTFQLLHSLHSNLVHVHHQLLHSQHCPSSSSWVMTFDNRTRRRCFLYIQRQSRRSLQCSKQALSFR